MNKPDPIEINRLAQVFFEASHIPMNMSDKELVVNGLTAVFDRLAEQSKPRFTNTMQNDVAVFHEKFGHPVGERIDNVPESRRAVRIELIREEFMDELIPAMEAGDLVETVDAAVDILYVTFGLLVEMGVDAQPLWDEVQRSNMSKLGADGNAIIAGPNDPDGIFEGRIKKGPHYFRPNLESVLVNMALTEYEARA